MDSHINFTKATLNKLPSAHGKSSKSYYDTKSPGLMLMVTPMGAKTFYVYRKVDGKPRRFKLGRYPELTPDQARKEAVKVNAKLATGIDPNAEKREIRARDVTLRVAFEAFKEARKTLKPQTLADYQRIMDTSFKDWHRTRLVDITKDKVAARHKKLGTERGEAYANLSMRILSSLLNFAAGQYEDARGNSLLPENPVKRLSQTRAWYRIKRRTSLIKAHQLPDWIAAVEDLRDEDAGSFANTVADYLLFLLLTGLRRQEGCNLRWVDVDMKEKTFTVPDTKNHEDHTLPLSDYLFDMLIRRVEVIGSEYVFPNIHNSGPLVEPRKKMAVVTEACGVEFTLHDLRRTFGTIAESIDMSAYAIKRLLNHKMTGDVTAGYIVADVERLRAPMQQITDVILAYANKEDANAT